MPLFYRLCDRLQCALRCTSRTSSYLPCRNSVPLHVLSQFQKLFVQYWVCSNHFKHAELPWIPLPICYLAACLLQEKIHRHKIPNASRQRNHPVSASVRCVAPIRSDTEERAEHCVT